MEFIYLYAGDAKLLSISDDCVESQKNLNSVKSFCSSHQLSLSPTKCQHLAIKHKDLIKNDYFIGDNQVSCSATVKNLCVLISSNLKWSSHVSQIVSSAFICSYRILKSFQLNIWTLLKAYTTYFRSKLEYNTSVWSPHSKRYMHAIESVQKNFTRKICIHCNVPFSSYVDRLCKLDLKYLEYCTLEFDLILTYKICYHLIDVKFDDFFQCAQTSYKLHRHSFVCG